MGYQITQHYVDTHIVNSGYVMQAIGFHGELGVSEMNSLHPVAPFTQPLSNKRVDLFADHNTVVMVNKQNINMITLPVTLHLFGDHSADVM